MQVSDKEKQILNLLKTGMDQKDIAKNVLVSHRSVKMIISSLCTRFGIESQKSIELVSYAIENGIIEKNALKGS
jgi:DNA-binding NarL/FixJ family response regulator